MRKLIDANAILRYLLGDHPQMSEETGQIIEDGALAHSHFAIYGEKDGGDMWRTPLWGEAFVRFIFVDLLFSS